MITESINRIWLTQLLITRASLLQSTVHTVRKSTRGVVTSHIHRTFDVFPL